VTRHRRAKAASQSPIGKCMGKFCVATADVVEIKSTASDLEETRADQNRRRQRLFFGVSKSSYLLIAGARRTPALSLVNLKGAPMILVTAEASYHAEHDQCTARYPTQAGVKTDFVNLGLTAPTAMRT